jgi:hypothetical protein
VPLHELQFVSNWILPTVFADAGTCELGGELGWEPGELGVEVELELLCVEPPQALRREAAAKTASIFNRSIRPPEGGLTKRLHHSL